MIPVRVSAAAQVTQVGGIKRLDPDHPLYLHRCPVCDQHYGDTDITLVYVGVEPDARRDSGYMTGAAVAVHVSCTHTGSAT